MREICILKMLSAYPQFVKLLDVIRDSNTASHRIHCIFEFCDQTLVEILNNQARLK
jgi:hypothetical protein